MTMKYVICAVGGLLWGFLAELLNCSISNLALKKNSVPWVMASNFLRLLVVVVALGAVFLLRNSLPSFVAAIVGTAAGMSFTMIVYAYWVMAKK
jgi:riboflavin transporter FmnP